MTSRGENWKNNLSKMKKNCQKKIGNKETRFFSVQNWVKKLCHLLDSRGLYYKHITIVNDDSRAVNK